MKSKWAAQATSVFSSLVAIVCPLCIPALGSLLASIGLGFALRVSFLRSLLILLLLIAVSALAWSAKLHRNWWVVLTGLVGAVLIYAGRYVWFSQILMWSGAIILIGTSILNFRLKVTCDRCR